MISEVTPLFRSPRVERLWVDAMVVLAPSNPPLARRLHVSLADLAGQEFVGLFNLDPAWQVRAPAAVGVRAVETCRCRAEQQAPAVEPVDLDEDGTRIVVAVTHDDRRCALDGTPADVGLHPEFRA